MSSFKLLLALYVFTCIACQQNNSVRHGNETSNSDAKAKRYNKDLTGPSEINSIIFGNYCGESNNSTWVYRYQLLIKDTVLLLTDTLHKNVVIDSAAYLKPLTDTAKVNSAIALLSAIPGSLLQDSNTTQWFHCADCPHFCTVFLVLQTKTGNKKISFSHEYKYTASPEIEDLRKKLDSTITRMLK
jgi:hypothetical protein